MAPAARHAWQCREQWAHLEERRVLKLGECFRLAGEDESPTGNAATVETASRKAARFLGHEGAVDVPDRLRRGLRHMWTGMQLELISPPPWIDLLFDMLDAGDVEEVVLIIMSKPFHLRRVDAGVRLGHIQDRHPDLGRCPGNATERQKTHQCDGYDHRQKRDRASQCEQSALMIWVRETSRPYADDHRRQRIVHDGLITS